MSGSLGNGPSDVRETGINLSLEIFPPRSEDAERQLRKTLDRLLPLDPSFVSVTYGTGGATRERTLATIERIKRQRGIVPAAHLTCYGDRRKDVDQTIARFKQAGVRHIVAVRGDARSVPEADQLAPNEMYGNAAELVGAIRRQGDFRISVAAYPECHPLSDNAATDLDALVAKFDAGADQAISQFFFRNSSFLRLRDRLAKRGIEQPLVAGILPIHDFAQMRRFARRCGAAIPRTIARGFAHIQDDNEMTRLFAISLAAEQVSGLIAEGVRDFHFYTLNRADLTQAVCQTTGIGANGLVSLPNRAIEPRVA